jgi:GntR family transcriptional regulator
LLYVQEVRDDETGPDLDRGSPVPLYRQLADYVEACVTSGAWEPGRKLPAERDLAEEWDVGYMTVRRTMQELRERGVVISVQGKGTFLRRGP